MVLLRLALPAGSGAVGATPAIAGHASTLRSDPVVVIAPLGILSFQAFLTEPGGRLVDEELANLATSRPSCP